MIRPPSIWQATRRHQSATTSLPTAKVSNMFHYTIFGQLPIGRYYIKRRTLTADGRPDNCEQRAAYRLMSTDYTSIKI